MGLAEAVLVEAVGREGLEGVAEERGDVRGRGDLVRGALGGEALAEGVGDGLLEEDVLAERRGGVAERGWGQVVERREEAGRVGRAGGQDRARERDVAREELVDAGRLVGREAHDLARLRVAGALRGGEGREDGDRDGAAVGAELHVGDVLERVEAQRRAELDGEAVAEDDRAAAHARRARDHVHGRARERAPRRLRDVQVAPLRVRRRRAAQRAVRVVREALELHEVADRVLHRAREVRPLGRARDHARPDLRGVVVAVRRLQKQRREPHRNVRLQRHVLRRQRPLRVQEQLVHERRVPVQQPVARHLEPPHPEHQRRARRRRRRRLRREAQLCQRRRARQPLLVVRRRQHRVARPHALADVEQRRRLQHPDAVRHRRRQLAHRPVLRHVVLGATPVQKLHRQLVRLQRRVQPAQHHQARVPLLVRLLAVLVPGLRPRRNPLLPLLLRHRHPHQRVLVRRLPLLRAHPRLCRRRKRRQCIGVLHP